MTNVYVTYADDDVSPRTASSSFDPYVPQGVVGRLMQTLTFGFSAAFADNPTLIDDYLRCSVATRPCTIEETLRKARSYSRRSPCDRVGAVHAVS